MQTADEARAAGRAAANEGGVALHDLTGHMNAIGVPAALQGFWLTGLEQGLEDLGFNVEGDEGDGHDWERKALAGIA